MPPSPVRRRWRFPAWPAWRSVRPICAASSVKLGVRIPDVAGEVQHNVKVAVQSMTGKPVNKVNVHIAGIVLDDPKPVNP